MSPSVVVYILISGLGCEPERYGTKKGKPNGFPLGLTPIGVKCGSG